MKRNGPACGLQAGPFAFGGGGLCKCPARSPHRLITLWPKP